MRNKRTDLLLGSIFALATVAFLFVFLTNDAFFAWAFARHHNILSWYIRPLFIIPIMLFAFRRSWSGISASIFALFSSMFWFPAPATSSPQVLSFLAYEMEYLQGTWGAAKILFTLAVPVFFAMLILAAWQRNWRWLVAVVVAAAVLKVAWSVASSGAAGMSIIKPAIAGLVICVGAIYLYRRRQLHL